ncbi:hypothetical protein KVR01_002759 [Diaporthe batatas]|uniref:uncharacterized protein n=1 Tax=Diaporthe batatas TaxID=748121 RepID=UPI001D03DC73|nr:uncharacterized protein KVR01_002759 [Diaporthe batatas]KAG8167070.1 hypothetical protein KVR01_002759 [Diaporthe batatas]
MLTSPPGRDSKIKQAFILVWWLGLALICIVATAVQILANWIRVRLLSAISIHLGNRRFKISPLAILVMIMTGVITAVSMEWLKGLTSLQPVATPLPPAYSCGQDCCNVWAACDIHIRLSTLLNETRRPPARHSTPGSLYAVLDVETTVHRAELRGAARSAAQRVEQRRYPDRTEPLVTELFRAAQFLEVEENRRLYDRLFLPLVQSETQLVPGKAASPPPREGLDVPGKLGPICSAALSACCDAAHGGF